MCRKKCQFIRNTTGYSLNCYRLFSKQYTEIRVFKNLNQKERVLKSLMIVFGR